MIDLLTILLVFLAILLILYIAWSIGGIVSLLAGGPLVPSPKTILPTMLELADIQPGERVVDLGSGDGRLVFAAAKTGAQAVGYEVSWPAWVWSRVLQILGGRGGTLKRANIFKISLQDADVVFCYLLPKTMAKLKAKLKQELPPRARVISNHFPVPGWPVAKQAGHVFLQYRP